MIKVNITLTIPLGLQSMRNVCKSLPLQIIINERTVMPRYKRDIATNQMIPTGESYNPTPAQTQRYLSSVLSKLKKDNKAFSTIVVRRKRQVIRIVDSESISEKCTKPEPQTLTERISNLNPVRVDSFGG